MQFDEQKLFVERIVKYISDIEEINTKKSLISNLIDECLSRKPYSKHLLVALVEGNLKNYAGLNKLARECLKSLTSEDLMQLA